MPIISVKGLSHVYSKDTPFEKTAISNIDLDIPRGQFLGLLGHTGSGKSTFVMHLNGLLKPTSGQIFYEGEDIFRTKEVTHGIRFKVGLIFQYPEYQLFEETVYKDVAFGPRNMGLSEAEIDERVHEAIGFVGLAEDVLPLSPMELSGGQKRRAAIAGIIAMRPEVLVLDEPTAGLDPSGKESILSNIVRYHKEKNSTVILVTHDIDEIAKIAERLVVFNKGGIVMDDTPDRIFLHAAELSEIGLSVPDATLIANRLGELGVELPKPIYTVEQLKSAILARGSERTVC